MAALGDLAHRVGNAYHALVSPPVAKLNSARPPLRMDILGTASIAPLAASGPCRSHSDIMVSGVASRSKETAQRFAEKHHIPHVFGSYSDLIHNAGIDAIYDPLPNSLHHERSLAATRAGKHVLLEKPSASNAD
ncbi:hypothetical protein ACQY0O_000450 [Thecaphora frezii]